MKRKTPQSPAGPGTDDAAVELGEGGEHRAVGRRALLTGGGAMAAAVGAGVAVAAAATPASAAVDSAVLQGEVNTAAAGANATEIAATSNAAAAPALIVTNAGSPAAGQASPALRLTPAASGLTAPAANTTGGDMVATSDGNLWFTHEVPVKNSPPTIIPAIVHTDATSNSFVPLAGPYRILDTRTLAGRSNVLDPSGKFDSAGRLKAGQIIHIDLTSLVLEGDAVTANLTVTGATHAGYLTLWSGAIGRPSASSINYTANQTIANLASVGIAAYGSTTDTIAIGASAGDTFVILDVAGFFVRNFAQVNPVYVGASTSAATRASRANLSYARP